MLRHPGILECAVVAAPDPERGTIVKAYIVTQPGVTANAAFAKTLQDFVKAEIAPYK